MKLKIGIIGCGHMGSTLARRLVLNENVDLYLSNRTKEKAFNLANELNSTYCSNEVCATCDYIIIGVKPQQYLDLFDSIKSYVKKDSIIISMMAGINISSINKYFNNPIIRIMPNTPCLVGNGMTFYCYSDDLNKDSLNKFLDFMKPTGLLSYIDEAKFDIATAISGSGPAFVDTFIDCLVKSGMYYGLDKEEAILLTEQMVLGSAALLIETKKDPLTLKDEVCSPGGSTIEGVKVLDNSDFFKVIKNCVEATYNKNKDFVKKEK